jgi:predicted Fe-Mo cluster-binding NifX family protein
MKVAVTAQGGGLGSELDPRFGRAKWFVVVDTETGEHVAIDNSAGAGAPSGAGVAAGQRVIEAGVDAVITGHCGPNAESVLKAAGIDIVERVGCTVQEAVDWFRSKHA